MANTKGSPWMFIIILFISILIAAGSLVLVLQSDIIESPEIILYGMVILSGLSFLVCLFGIIAGKKKVEKSRDEKVKPAVTAAPPPPPEASTQSAEEQTMLLLSLLQEKGRFIDFIMQDVATYSDEQVGAAARVVHQGCRDLIIECFKPSAISKIDENASITLEAGFNPREYKIVGNISGQPPYSGTLIHKGWKVQQIKLPKLSRSSEETPNRVIIPAEVEL